MLFKSDVPVSHRMVLVLAVVLTVKVLVELRIRSAFPILEVCVATALWLVVLYTSMKRVRWRAQEANGHIERRFNAVDRMLQPAQSRFQGASVTMRVVFWAAITFVAILMYLVSRGLA
jgi:hypothetical protein